MVSRWSRTFRSTRLLAAAALASVVFTASPRGQQPAGGPDEAMLRAAIERALASVPRGFEALRSPAQAGVRLVDVDVEQRSATAHRITIDLSQRLLTYDPSGDVALVLDAVIASTAPLTASARDVDYRFLVDGIALDQFLSRAGADRRLNLQVGTAGRVVVSPGHGLYRHEESGQWRFQREFFWGIVEDLVNHDIVSYLLADLRRLNFDARPARNPDRSSAAGVSGQPRWHEGAKYYIRDLGAPPSVWDFGADDYAKDINSRPFYANWIDSAVIVSIHNNGGGGTGTETWIDTTNPYAAESRRLAEIVNRQVVAAIRARYDANWPDRGLRSCNGCHGENRLANRPAILLEVAFMDTRNPDNTALQDERFKQIVAQAVREGLEEWGLRPAAPEDVDSLATREITARAAQDARFGSAVGGSFGLDLNWDPGWELRWLDFPVTGGRTVRVFHVTMRSDRGTRFVGFWDPDTDVWHGWDRVS